MLSKISSSFFFQESRTGESPHRNVFKAKPDAASPDLSIDSGAKVPAYCQAYWENFNQRDLQVVHSDSDKCHEGSLPTKAAGGGIAKTEPKNDEDALAPLSAGRSPGEGDRRENGSFASETDAKLGSDERQEYPRESSDSKDAVSSSYARLRYAHLFFSRSASCFPQR